MFTFMAPTAEIILERIKEGNKLFRRNCSMCNYPCGYVWINDPGYLAYDGGCNCTRWKDVHPRPIMELERFTNMELPYVPCMR